MKATNYSTTLLTPQELSVLLNVSEFTVKELARIGELPCRYSGRRPMFELKVVLELLEKLQGGAA